MEKQEKIVQMFDNIAPSYDKANKILSFGIDTKWRKDAIKNLLNKFEGQNIKIVDVACGTGDMMGLWSSTSSLYNVKIDDILGVDPSVEMLKIAKHKFPNFNFINSYGDQMDIEDNFADILSISYGIRNVIARKKTLKEFNRCLKMGGYLLVLEFSKSHKKGFLANFRDFYLNKILPKIGGFVSKNKEAYEYLPNSIKDFLDANEFANELQENGFEIIMIKPSSLEISTTFIAKKIHQC